MADHTPETPSRFVTKKVTGAAVEVDCSGWQDTTGWTAGGLVARKVTHPATQCELTLAPMHLELIVSFEEDTPPAAVMKHANRLMQLACTAAPELGLTYDFTRTRAEDTGDVILVLTPTKPVDAELRMGEIVRLIEAAMQSEATTLFRLKGVVARAA